MSNSQQPAKRVCRAGHQRRLGAVACREEPTLAHRIRFIQENVRILAGRAGPDAAWICWVAISANMPAALS